jgi:DNA processing protein
VLACGPEQIYPPEHRGLALEMEAEGAIVSEMPVDTPPRALHFPLRNRIISGLCLAVIVVEARSRSGSLITVRHALQQGREVFVVPGSIEGPFAQGTNQLLRDGARAIRSARDVIEDLGLDDPAGLGSDPSGEVPLPEDEGGTLEARILAALERGPVTRDQLLTRVEPDAGRVAAALLELELGGRIVEERDGRIHLRWS